MTTEQVTTTISTKWDGSDEDFWDAVAAYNNLEMEETATISAAVLLQQVLMLAQDALNRLTNPPTEPSSAPAVPLKVVQRPKPGDVVDVPRAVELFAEGWVLRPAGPVGESTLSAVRDYRVFEGALQYNASYPEQWQESAGTISDCPQWVVVTQQKLDGTVSNGRTSRTSIRTTG